MNDSDLTILCCAGLGLFVVIVVGWVFLVGGGAVVVFLVGRWG